MERRYVVIEGLIGVGKTTLCRLLAADRRAELVLEPHEDNPFLEPYYRDPERYALPVQMYFLLTRFRQQDKVRQLSLFNEWVISDYLFEKDRLFAEKTLSTEDLDIYDRIASSLVAKIATPDLVVSLHAPTRVLLQRIQRRGIAGEERIDASYLDDLRRRYDRLWADWTRCPVLHVDNEALDVTQDPDARAEVLRRIDDALANGPRRIAPPNPAQPSLFP